VALDANKRSPISIEAALTVSARRVGVGAVVACVVGCISCGGWERG
jgi:hypothetical protein